MPGLPTKIVALVPVFYKARSPTEEKPPPSDTSTPPAGWGREQSGHQCPHLLDGETEAQKEEVIHPSSHSLKKWVRDFR